METIFSLLDIWEEATTPFINQLSGLVGANLPTDICSLVLLAIFLLASYTLITVITRLEPRKKKPARPVAKRIPPPPAVLKAQREKGAPALTEKERVQDMELIVASVDALEHLKKIAGNTTANAKVLVKIREMAVILFAQTEAMLAWMECPKSGEKPDLDRHILFLVVEATQSWKTLLELAHEDQSDSPTAPYTAELKRVDGNFFCGDCGSQLLSTELMGKEPATAIGSRYCPQCNAPIPKGYDSCPRCREKGK